MYKHIIHTYIHTYILRPCLYSHTNTLGLIYVCMVVTKDKLFGFMAYQPLMII